MNEVLNPEGLNIVGARQTIKDEEAFVTILRRDSFKTLMAAAIYRATGIQGGGTSPDGLPHIIAEGVIAYIAASTEQATAVRRAWLAIKAAEARIKSLTYEPPELTDSSWEDVARDALGKLSAAEAKIADQAEKCARADEVLYLEREQREHAEERIAELDSELFGYRQMAASYEESDELHARLSKAEALATAAVRVEVVHGRECDERNCFMGTTIPDLRAALKAFKDSAK